jgi:hypothetical protein
MQTLTPQRYKVNHSRTGTTKQTGEHMNSKQLAELKLERQADALGGFIVGALLVLVLCMI